MGIVKELHPEITDYLLTQFQILTQSGYKENGTYANCTGIAFNVGRIALRHGEKPYIGEIQVAGAVDPFNTPLIPRHIEGKPKMGFHRVCMVEDLVLDPIADTPTPLLEYLLDTFENPDIDFFVWRPVEMMPAYYGRFFKKYLFF